MRMQVPEEEKELIFDSHAHMDTDAFDEDREAVLERAFGGNISYILNPGVDLKSSEDAVELARRHPRIYAAVGYHPQMTGSLTEEILEKIRELAGDPRVVAVGEIGLDYFRETAPREVQQYWFRRQIRLAVELGLPFAIHDREAHGDTLKILEEERAFEQTKVLFHCYSGSAEMARQLLRKDCWFSISGSATYGNNKKAKAVLDVIPLDRMMVETDAPFLTPVPRRGERNEPAFIEYTVRKIAEYKGLTFEETAEATCRTAKGFFGID